MRRLGNKASGYRKSLSRQAINALRRQIRGRIVLPQDPDYDQARRLVNPRFDPHPTAVIYCVEEQDVRSSLRALRRHRTTFRIRAGGHSTAGYSASDDVVLDVSGLKTLRIDATRQTAIVGCGCTQEMLNDKLAPYNLYVPVGGENDVCIGGFVQGGGWGLLSRTLGMNCDSVVEMRVMLGDGRIVRASERRNYDLWWALRGGTGGNFGVLLTVKYRLHKLDDISGWILQWPLRLASAGPRRWRNPIAALTAMQRLFSGEGTPEVGAAALVGWFDPKPLTSALQILVSFAGRPADAKRVLKPLFDIPGAVRTPFAQTSSAQTSSAASAKTASHHHLTRVLASKLTLPSSRIAPPTADTGSQRHTRFVSRWLEPEDWRDLISLVFKPKTPSLQLEIQCFGGAIKAYPYDKSAFVHRDASCCAYLLAGWSTAAEHRAAEAYLHDWCAMMEPYWNGQIYQNFPDEDYKNYRLNYWGEVFPTLLAVKCKYDPSSFFSFPQMICPPEGSSNTFPSRVAKALQRAITYDD